MESLKEDFTFTENRKKITIKAGEEVRFIKKMNEEMSLMETKDGIRFAVNTDKVNF